MPSGDVHYTVHWTDWNEAVEISNEVPPSQVAFLLGLGFDGWDNFWRDYYHFYHNPDEMEDWAQTTRNVAIVTAAGASAAAGGVYVVGAMQAGGTGTVFATLSAGTVANANRLNHIFVNVGHRLAPVLNHFGGNAASVFAAIEAAAVQRLAVLGITSGRFEVLIFICGQRVTVRGNIIDGVVRIGTAFIE